jgi:hypothetical protein
MRLAILMAAALILAPLPALSQEAQRSESHEPANVERGRDRDARAAQPGDPAEPEFRHRMVSAIEAVENACAADIHDLCGRVTPGAGRLALCMRAHEDQFSRRCQWTLERASQVLESSAHRVVETCWNEVRKLCGDADRVGQCVGQKKASLSASCNAVVTILGQKVQALMAQVGMPVYSSDDKALGQVAQVVKGEDGKVQSIQVDIGHMLGLGTKVVVISADKFEQLAGIKLRLSDAEIRSLPEARQQ